MCVGEREELPAVRHLLSHFLQVCVAHVVNAKDEAVLVLRDAFSDILE